MKLSEQAKKALIETLNKKQEAISHISKPFDDNISSFINGFALGAGIEPSTHTFDFEKMEFIKINTDTKIAKEGASNGTDNG